MSNNSSEQRAAQLLQDVLEDAYLDQLEAELDREHPVDSETFLENLTTGRLSVVELAAFQEHQRNCLFCSDVVAGLRDRCHMPWLPEEESAPPTSALLSASPAPVTTAETSPGTAIASRPDVVPGSPAATLERAREQFAMRERAGHSRPRPGIGRLVAFAAAVAAVLLFALPGIRTFFRPAELRSAFTTAAMLSDYGLIATTNPRDFSPTEADVQQAKALREQMQATPQDPVAILNLAAQQLRQRQFEESRVLIESVLQNRPKDPVVLNALGLVQTAMNEPQTAMGSFRQALAARPLFVPAALNLTELLIRQEQRNAARQILSELLPVAATAADKQQLQQRLEDLNSEL